jgi:ArsR family transcriptional regulator, arsenate/arsenite/antimonite-responsive transcriptional repressor
MTPEILFRTLADETRLRCLMLLLSEPELCVCELTHALGVVQPKVSRHLAILRESGLVEDERRGLWVYYRLRPDLPSWAHEVLAATAAGVAAAEPHVSDRRNLQAMPDRPLNRCCA